MMQLKWIKMWSVIALFSTLKDKQAENGVVLTSNAAPKEESVTSRAFTKSTGAYLAMTDAIRIRIAIAWNKWIGK